VVEVAPRLQLLPLLLSERPYGLEDEELGGTQEAGPAAEAAAGAAAGGDGGEAMEVDAAGPSGRLFSFEQLLELVQVGPGALGAAFRLPACTGAGPAGCRSRARAGSASSVPRAAGCRPWGRVLPPPARCRPAGELCRAAGGAAGGGGAGAGRALALGGALLPGGPPGHAAGQVRGWLEGGWAVAGLWWRAAGPGASTQGKAAAAAAPRAGPEGPAAGCAPRPAARVRR
jgi:hypothetical protein